MRPLDIVTEFARALDRDDFSRARTCLAPACTYHIGEQTLTGPDAIVASYENAMIAGRKKFDELVWGEATVEAVDAATFDIRFTDFITHRGRSYTHRCTQRVSAADGAIGSIRHQDDPEETKRLLAFYAEVGVRPG